MRRQKAAPHGALEFGDILRPKESRPPVRRCATRCIDDIGAIHPCFASATDALHACV